MMIASFFFSLILLTLSSSSLAQETNFSLAVTQFTPCAIPCLTAVISQSHCAPTDRTCICSDQQLYGSAESCILQSCTLKQALTTLNATETLCEAPVRNKQKLLRETSISLGVFTALCVLVRIVHKAVFSVAELGWDDYCIIAVVLLGIPNTIIINVGAIASGLGRDIWTLPFDHITSFLRWFYLLEIMYFMELAMIKLALLLFFLRIFPARNIRRIIWSSVAVTAIWGVIFAFLAIFQCQPISYYWHVWDGEHKGYCIDINALGWANACINIALDIWLLVLPLSQVFTLQLSMRKKISVALMFSVGLFVTIVSIVRLQSLIHFGNSSNPTWDQVGVNNWSVIEINVGIICACMPSFRMILCSLFPNILGSTKNGTSGSIPMHSTHKPQHRRGNLSQTLTSVNGGDRDGIGGVDDKAIAHITTFEVMYGGRLEDEERLVVLEDMNRRQGKNAASSASSQVSVGAAKVSTSAYTMPVHR